MARRFTNGAFLVATLVFGLMLVLQLQAITAAPNEEVNATTSENTKADDSAAYESGTPVDRINAYIRRVWKDNEITPSKPATDGEWCRRVYLDTIGRIPSVEELQAFLKTRGKDKKAQLVDRLLGSEYEKEYTKNWTTIWTNILIGRTGGTERRSLTSRPGMKKYLRASIRANKPYNKMVYELIAATGSTKPKEKDFNGATNFLSGKLAENGIQATAKTSQIFLGMQVQCTQCHNHPFNEYKQNQFWEMNAYFRQTRALRSFDDREIANVELIDEDFAGDSGNAEDAELFYELRNGLLRSAYPVFIDGDSLAEKYKSKGETFGNSGYLEDINRRKELAKKVVESPLLRKEIANRMWGHYLGYGFTKPIDDLGPHNSPSHPELLEFLGEELQAVDFDLKKMMRWIVLSEAYSLSSKMNKDQMKIDDPSIGTRPFFSHYYLRQMQAEELYESLLTATQAAGTLDKKMQDEVRQRWLKQFSTAFGTDENDEATTFNGSIPQVLMMMNGELTKKACGTAPGSFLYKVATDGKLKNAERVQYLYLAALARRPTGEEIAACNKLVIGRKGNVAAALQDIWWALLNSNEFILNH